MPVNPEEAIWFVSQLRATKGKYAGSPLQLQEFQKEIIRNVLKLKPDGRRQFREVLLGLGRKNGKTELTAGIALALLVLDGEPGGEVIGAAAKRDQARLMLDAAKKMVQMSSIGGRPLTDFLVVRRDSIYFPELDATYRVIAADAQKEHGLNPHAVIVDEAHATMETSRELYDTLLTAQGARENPIAISITTAGPLPTGPLHDLYRYGKEIQAGLRNDPDFLMLWWEAEADAAVDDPEAWKAANPALGTFLFEDFLERAARDVLNGKAPEFMFRRLHLNQWTTAHERWLPFTKWQACGDPPDVPDGSPVYIAIDAALRRDTFAVVTLHVDADGVGHTFLKRFVPPTEGAYIDWIEVETYVLGLCSRYQLVRGGYDPAFMQLLGQRLKDRGLPFEEFPQSAERMTKATETLQRIVLDGRLRHGNEPILNDQVASIAVKPTERGVRISKTKAGLPIDGAVALAMAIEMAFGEEAPAEDFAFFVD